MRLDHLKSIAEAAIYTGAVVYFYVAEYLEPTLHWATLSLGVAGGVLLLRYRWLQNRLLEEKLRALRSGRAAS